MKYQSAPTTDQPNSDDFKPGEALGFQDFCGLMRSLTLNHNPAFEVEHLLIERIQTMLRERIRRPLQMRRVDHRDVNVPSTCAELTALLDEHMDSIVGLTPHDLSRIRPHYGDVQNLWKDFARLRSDLAYNRSQRWADEEHVLGRRLS